MNDIIASVSLDGLTPHLIAYTLSAHSSYILYGDVARNVGRCFMIFMVLGNMKRGFFCLFLHIGRHPADSDGRPTAVAQVLVTVSMMP